MTRRSGVSFVEVALAALILGLALLPTFGLMIQNTRGVRITADELQATNLACSCLEAVQAMGFDELPETTDPDGTPVEGLDPAVRSRLALPSYDAERFALRLTVTPAAVELPGSAGADPDLQRRAALRVVRVSCQWKTKGFGEGGGFDRARAITLASIVSRAVHR